MHYHRNNKPSPLGPVQCVCFVLSLCPGEAENDCQAGLFIWAHCLLDLQLAFSSIKPKQGSGRESEFKSLMLLQTVKNTRIHIM